MRSRNRSTHPPSIGTAAAYAGYITVLVHMLFSIMFIYGRNALMPYDAELANRPVMDPWVYLFGVGFTYVYIFALFCVNFYVLSRERYPNRWRTIAAIVISLLCIVAWNQFAIWFQGTVFDLPPLGPRALRGGLARDMVLGAAVIFSSQIVYLNHRRYLIMLENEALKAENERARYGALRNQVNPHFLFNTLNTLNSIITTDPDKAQRYVQMLSSIFRYTTQDRDTTTLADEIAFTRNYGDLMQVRYGDNLRIEFAVDPRWDDCEVVPFSVQTLVENAIKHNVITDRHPLTLRIETLRMADTDYVTVSNPLNPKKNEESGEGVGLANLAGRYRLKWDKEVIIRNDGREFSVSLPLMPPATFFLLR